MKKHSRNGLEELQEEEKVVQIATLCKSVDFLLGGGIRPGTLTEVVGLPGVGKTTFCLQLCLTVQTPTKLQGPDGEAIYIGTNHSFSNFRLSQLAKEFVTRCNRIFASRLANQIPLSVDEVLRRIHVVQCCTLEELKRVVISMEKFLQSNNRVRVIILDGIDFPMFTENESFSTRVKVLYELVQFLLPYLVKYKVAIVITNSMTTRFGPCGSSGSGEYFVPYLGDAWNYVPNQILKFSYTPMDRSRKAELVKSAFCKGGLASYRIIHGGFRE